MLRFVEHRHAVAHVLEGDAEFFLALADFIQQPCVLHRDDRLGSEVFQQGDLPLGERRTSWRKTVRTPSTISSLSNGTCRNVRIPPSSAEATANGALLRYGSSALRSLTCIVHRSCIALPKNDRAGSGRIGAAVRYSATLAMLVQQTLGHDPFSGAVYAFRGRRGGLIKVL